MSEIKSAWEKALERANKLGQLSDEEAKRLEYMPVGNSIAAQYLNDDSFDLIKKINSYKNNAAIKYIIQGIIEILLRNIVLPQTERDKHLLQRALNGIRNIKNNKKQVESVISQINNLINYYEQAVQHTFSQFKQEFENKIRASGAQLQQMMNSSVNLEMQIQQQFQDEWRQIIKNLNQKYEQALEEQKKILIEID